MPAVQLNSDAIMVPMPHGVDTVFYYNEGQDLIIELKPELYNIKTALYTNHVGDGGVFERERFKKIKRVVEKDPKTTQIGRVYFSVPKLKPGHFDYFLLVADKNIVRFPLEEYFFNTVYLKERQSMIPDLNKMRYLTWLEASPAIRLPSKFYVDSFIVQPVLGGNNDKLALNEIKLQTVVSKLLGPISRWKDVLTVSVESGFNMLHFTPLQKRGQSQSAFSICDQLSLDDSLGIDGKNEFGKLMSNIKNELCCIAKTPVFTITDVVFNHTADNSMWLLDHPESTFNLKNSSHLLAPFAIDQALAVFANNFELKQIAELNSLNGIVNNSKEIDLVLDYFKKNIIPRLELWDFFVLPVNSLLKQYEEEGEYASIDQDKQCSYSYALYRLRAHLPRPTMNSLANLKLSIPDVQVLGINCDPSVFKRALDEINMDYYHVYDQLIVDIISNLSKRTLYRVLTEIPSLTKTNSTTKHALFERYFTVSARSGIDSKESKIRSYKDYLLPSANITTTAAAAAFSPISLEHIFANNGWVFGSVADTHHSFVDTDSLVYLKRDLMVWTDCVKLNYGTCIKDSTYLWQRMKEYTQWTAAHFDGFRIDNCHSTPCHVAKYMLDVAREIKPKFIAIAELFTGSAEQDIMFSKKIGLNLLIREGMAVESNRDFIEKNYQYETKLEFSEGRNITIIPELGKMIDQKQTLPVLYMDMTHDNSPPSDKRGTSLNQVPNSFLAFQMNVATGSTMMYDYFYPSPIDLVNETLLYPTADELANFYKNKLGDEITFSQYRQELSAIHKYVCQHGFKTISANINEQGLLTIEKYSANKSETLLLYSYSMFSAKEDRLYGNIKLSLPLFIPQQFRYYKISYSTDHPSISNGSVSPHNTNLLRNTKGPVYLKQDSDDSLFTCVDIGAQIYTGREFMLTPGSILMITYVNNHLPPLSNTSSAFNDFTMLDFSEHIFNFSLFDMNQVLFQCGPEELAQFQEDCYRFPGLPNQGYAGLYGHFIIISSVFESNGDGSGHYRRFVDHMREGTWAMDYIVRRLDKYPFATSLSEHLKFLFNMTKQYPLFEMIDRFVSIVVQLIRQLINRVLLIIPGIGEANRSNKIMSMLFLSSIQFLSTSEAAPGLDSKLAGPVKALYYPEYEKTDFSISHAAGLPYFSVGYMRSWGRDTFLSFKGSLLLTGRFDDAKSLLLIYLGTLAHGLIPNLLFSSSKARYNARDAVWYCLESIQAYCMYSPEGLAFLKTPVYHLIRISEDECIIDLETRQVGKTVLDCFLEILDSHAKGIHFTELFSGPQLDQHMCERGFNVDVYVDNTTGVVCGGNEWNCGTWMDKMGSSTMILGNKGIPSTPRDGAAIEIVGLQKSAVRWICSLINMRYFETIPFVTIDGINWEYAEWNIKLQASFESMFFVNEVHYSTDDCSYYKDSVLSSNTDMEIMFRPNALIAMVVAPELFDTNHALAYLKMVDRWLLGKYGIKTLDPRHIKYNGYYCPNEASVDVNTIDGANYHNGPEWLWLTGYYYQALIIFQGKAPDIVSKIYSHMQDSISLLYATTPWLGLPELTQADGILCPASCPTQSWSISTYIEAIHMMNYEKPTHH